MGHLEQFNDCKSIILEPLKTIVTRTLHSVAKLFFIQTEKLRVEGKRIE